MNTKYVLCSNTLHLLLQSLSNRKPLPAKIVRLHEVRLYAFAGQSFSNSSIPGGHSMHPSAPLEEEFEKVPSGHGRNV